MVPYAAGGPSDGAIRALANNLSSKYSNGVKVENVLGDGGLKGLREFVNQSNRKIDLILLSSATFMQAAAKDPKLLDNIKPISLISIAPMVLISTKPWESVIKEAKENMKITMGVPALGSTSHLCAEQIADSLGVTLGLDVYKGAGPLMVSIISNNVTLACVEIPVAATFIKLGKISAVAVSSDEGVAMVGNTPTFEQLGLNTITKGQWYIFAGLENSSEDFSVNVSNAIRSALQYKLTSVGFNFVPSDAASNEIALTFIKKEYARMKPYLKIMSQ